MAEAEQNRIDVFGVALAMADAASATDAPDALLKSVMHSVSASGGAVILRREGSYVVELALDERGDRLSADETLLSEMVVRDVLHSGEPIHVRGALTHPRYSEATSVLARQMKSVACLPIGAPPHVLGALFLASVTERNLLSSAEVDAIQLLATTALPFLLKREQERAESNVSDDLIESMLPGESARMSALRETLRRVAPLPLSVLIRGETGSGKDVVARAVHALSQQSDRPMVSLNCAAVPENLLAAELFGAEKGAYTGIDQSRRGRLELAHESTLFLDEVGDMPLPMQAVLLRALEEGAVTPLGSESSRPAKFRLLAATHRDLDQEVASGKFREDLLFRLREVELNLPPLRERGDDLLLLSRMFIRSASMQFGSKMPALSDAALEAMRSHPWKGNVRELKSCLRRAVALSAGETIAPEHLQLGGSLRPSARSLASDALEEGLSLSAARDSFSRRVAEEALGKHGSREAAAAALGISTRSLYRLLH